MSITLGRFGYVPYQVTLISAAILLWEILVNTGILNPVLIASPTRIIPVFSSPFILREMALNLGTTLFEIGIAFPLGSFLGVTIGGILGTAKELRSVISPYLALIYSTPKSLFLPLLVLWLGFGADAKILYGALHSFLMVTIATMAAMRSLKQGLVTTAVAFGASNKEIFYKVVLPSIVPAVLGAARVGFNLTVISILLAEMYASTAGIGALVQFLAQEFRSGELFAVVLILACFTIAVNQGLLRLEHHLIRWKP